MFKISNVTFSIFQLGGILKFEYMAACHLFKCRRRSPQKNKKFDVPLPDKTIRASQTGHCGSQTRHCVVPMQDIMSLPRRTLCGFQARHCVFATEDTVWFPNRTMCGSQTGHCVVPKQDIVSLQNKTLCDSRTRH